MSAPTRPVLRYHGGKWRLAPWIIEHFPAHRVYVEPFGGGGSVLMRKPRSYAEVYNEADGEVVNLFRVLRDIHDAAELRRVLDLTPFARDEFVLSYARDVGAVEQARRTVVRSFMGHGSAAASGKATGFRSNSNRSGTTPAHDWVNWPATIAALTDRLRGVVIENGDAFEIIPRFDTPTTLFYVDPPYPKSTRDNAGHDYRFEMDDDGHRRLASTLRAVVGMVALSGYRCPLYDDLYGDWASHAKASHADGARDRTEVLWLNPACSAAIAASESQGSLLGGAA